MNMRQISQQRLRDKLIHECGETFIQALNNPSVIEIMVNADGKLWLDTLGQGMQLTNEIFSSRHVENILMLCASFLQTTLTRSSPILEGEFPLEGSRLAGLIPPVVIAPVLALRKKASQVIHLEKYATPGNLMTPHTLPESKTRKCLAAEILREALRSRKNILIAGGTGSGKTTLVNSLLAELASFCANERFIVIEDTRELHIPHANHVALRSTDDISMQRLLRTTLRLRPDRIIVGEVRGGEALTLLKAWNTGHPGGIATLHANSPMGALSRLAQLIEENAGIRANPQFIAESVDLIVIIERTATGRYITEMVEVKGFMNHEYRLKSLLTE